MEHTKLGQLEDIPMPKWPRDYSMTIRSSKNHLLNYRICNVETEADCIAEIYQKAIDEIHGNTTETILYGGPMIWMITIDSLLLTQQSSYQVNVAFIGSGER